MSWICGWAAEVEGMAGAFGPGVGDPADSRDVRCAGGAGLAGPGRPGRDGAAGRGPGTGRGVGAVRLLAGMARGPWALS